MGSIHTLIGSAPEKDAKTEYLKQTDCFAAIATRKDRTSEKSIPLLMRKREHTGSKRNKLSLIELTLRYESLRLGTCHKRIFEL